MKQSIALICTMATMAICPTARAADTLSVAQRWASYSAPMQAFLPQATSNPALGYWRQAQALTTIGIGGDISTQRYALQPQMGDGGWQAEADVHSFTRTAKSAVWGQASYTSGRKHNVLYNETSDVNLLYPYLMGDSVGGTLRTQTYRFGGGFTRLLSKEMAIGLNADYCAGIDYRQIDPRPKNLTNDLHISLGLSGIMNTDYRWGTAVGIGKYKQTNSLAFYSELGVPNVLHFTGLGNDYNRFRGSNIDTYYNGYHATAQATLLPMSQGIKANVEYRYWTFTKHITSLNQLPMARAAEHTLSGQLAYVQPRTQWAVGASGTWSRRQGTENIFGDAADNVYPQINALPQYTRTTWHTELQALRTWNRQRLQGHIRPNIGYKAESETYNSPRAHMHLRHLGIGMEGGLGGNLRRTIVQATLQGHFWANSDAALSLSAQGYGSIPTQTYYTYLAHHYTDAAASLSVTYAISHKLALQLAMHYDATVYRGNLCQQNAIRLAFLF